jgi:predicted ATPase
MSRNRCITLIIEQTQLVISVELKQMLTRLYIDNFRCLVKFEYRPERKQLIVGRNGSGKTTLLDALFFLRQFASRGDNLDKSFILSQRTRWLNQRQQVFELEALLDQRTYVYRVVIEPSGEPAVPTVSLESVHVDAKAIFEFENGNVQLYSDAFERAATYPFDSSRSALATITPASDNLLLTRFRRWFGTLFCFRIDPFDMGARADTETLSPDVRLKSFAAWYRHLLQANPKDNAALLESLRAAIDVEFLGLEPFGENVRLLFAELSQGSNPSIKVYFNELSDGQRCLICLYTILHFLLAKGSTVILDEPDNFVSLREIQPWLMRTADMVEEGHGQIILISHHPEMINQWAPCCGLQFVREAVGPVRIEEFRGEPKSHLSPAELVARGWERE